MCHPACRHPAGGVIRSHDQDGLKRRLHWTALDGSPGARAARGGTEGKFAPPEGSGARARCGDGPTGAASGRAGAHDSARVVADKRSTLASFLPLRLRGGYCSRRWRKGMPGLLTKKHGALMDRISIVGGQPLHGTIPISGAKNAALPLMIASLLTPDTLILENVPRLADVALLQRILNNHGVDVTVNGKRPGDTAYQGQTLHISAANIVDTTAPYELVSKMRASFWVIGPLVARMGEAKVSMP